MTSATAELDFFESLRFAIEAIVDPMRAFFSAAGKRARYDDELAKATSQLTLKIVSASTDAEYAAAARSALASAHHVGVLFRKAHKQSPKRTSARDLAPKKWDPPAHRLWDEFDAHLQRTRPQIRASLRRHGFKRPKKQDWQDQIDRALVLMVPVLIVAIRNQPLDEYWQLERACRDARVQLNKLGRLFGVEEEQLIASKEPSAPVVEFVETDAVHARPLVLNEVELRNFKKLMESPPPPSDALKKAWARHAR